MSKFAKLIDDICNDNDYLFTFRVHDETKVLVRELIKLRDGEVDNTTEVLKALTLHLDLLNQQIEQATQSKVDEVVIIYLQDILSGLEKSRQRICNHCA